jgi:hypothetical protein
MFSRYDITDDRDKHRVEWFGDFVQSAQFLELGRANP